MKPKGHKARKLLEAEAHVRDKDLEQIITEEFLGPHIETASERNFEIECDCGASTAYPYEEALEQKTVYACRCVYCKRTEYVRMGEKESLELIPEPKTGKIVALEFRHLTPETAFSEWCKNQPPSKEIDPSLATRETHLKTSLKALKRELECQGKAPMQDSEFLRLLDELKKLDSQLTHVWLDLGDRCGYKRPKLRDNERAKLAKEIACDEVHRQDGMDKAVEACDLHRLEQKAEELALEDTRGHHAPLVADPHWLVAAARDVIPRDRLPERSLVYDFAAFIHADDRRTWPTMMHLRMAFAERDEVIRSALRTMPRRQKGKGRKTRYTPDELLFLIDWWLNRKGESEKGEHRAGFEHIKRASCDTV